jgi:hypothetical protein
MNKARLIYLACSLSMLVFFLQGLARVVGKFHPMGGDSWHDGG